MSIRIREYPIRHASAIESVVERDLYGTERPKRLRQGIKDGPHAHLAHMAVPVKTALMRFDRVGETWAAISLNLLPFGFVALVFIDRQRLLAELTIITLLFIVIESILRGAFVPTVGQITAMLGMISGTILLFRSGL